MTGWRGDSETGRELVVLQRHAGSSRPGTRTLADYRGQWHHPSSTPIRCISHSIRSPRLRRDLLDDKRLQRRSRREGLHTRQDRCIPPCLNRRRLSGHKKSKTVGVDHGDQSRSPKPLSTSQLTRRGLKKLLRNLARSQGCYRLFWGRVPSRLLSAPAVD